MKVMSIPEGNISQLNLSVPTNMDVLSQRNKYIETDERTFDDE